MVEIDVARKSGFKCSRADLLTALTVRPNSVITKSQLDWGSFSSPCEHVGFDIDSTAEILDVTVNMGVGIYAELDFSQGLFGELYKHDFDIYVSFVHARRSQEKLIFYNQDHTWPYAQVCWIVDTNQIDNTEWGVGFV